MQFLPKNPAFFDVFEQIAVAGRDAGAALRDLRIGSPQAKKQAQAITVLEGKADNLCHQLSLEADRTFITPIDREDIHALAHTLDEIVDVIENIASNIVLFHVEKPLPQYTKFTALIKETTIQVAEVIRLLSFKDKKIPEIKEVLVQIHRLENEGDALMREALDALFSQQKDPITIIKWKDLYEELESVLDTCEDTADVVHQIIVKNF